MLHIVTATGGRYKTVEDLGSPSDAANKLLDRYLNKEFMSTRLGIRRQGEVVAASSREKDGRVYYDIEVGGPQAASSHGVVVAVTEEAWAETGGTAWALVSLAGTPSTQTVTQQHSGSTYTSAVPGVEIYRTILAGWDEISSKIIEGWPCSNKRQPLVVLELCGCFL